MEQVADFAALHTAYAAAYQTAVDPSTRTKGKVAAKNTAKDALTTGARELAKVVEATVTVTDEQKIDLGLNVRKPSTPIPVPENAPDLDIISVTALTVKMRMHDIVSERRGRPAGVAGANVFTFVGETPPTELSDWKFAFNTTKTIVDIEFEGNLAPGTQVWLAAEWYNPRAQAGPTSNPITTYLQGGISQAA